MTKIVLTVSLSSEQLNLINKGEVASVLLGHLGSLMPFEGNDIFLRIQKGVSSPKKVLKAKLNDKKGGE